MSYVFGRWTIKLDNDKQLWFAHDLRTGESLYSDDRSFLVEVLEQIGK